MKKLNLILTILMAAVLGYAAPSSVRPESSVPTPAENAEISREMPDLGAKESADWQRLRAERRAAREQILKDLRNSSAAEKKNIREEVSKKWNGNARFEGDSPKNFEGNSPKNFPKNFEGDFPRNFEGDFPKNNSWQGGPPPDRPKFNDPSAHDNRGWNPNGNKPRK